MPCQGLAVGSGKFCRMEQGFRTIKRSHLPRQPFLEWVHVFQGGAWKTRNGSHPDSAAAHAGLSSSAEPPTLSGVHRYLLILKKG